VCVGGGRGQDIDIGAHNGPVELGAYYESTGTRNETGRKRDPKGSELKKKDNEFEELGDEDAGRYRCSAEEKGGRGRKGIGGCHSQIAKLKRD